MKVQVTVNNVKIIEPSILNENEYNIHECEFEFTEEYNGLTKKAVFTNEANETYVETIVDNICSIPSEVLKDKENVKLGVYAYDVDNEELLLRYSPRPTEFYVHEGSYKEGQNSTPPTPSEIEQLQSQITTNANNIEELQECCGRYDSDIAEIKAEQITQNTSIHNNADNIETINEQISDINEAITNLETNKANVTDLNALTERVSTNERNIDTIDGHISDINQNIDDLEQDLTNYSLITETGSQINLNVNSTNYQIKAILKDKNGNVIYTSNAIDLPIESMIVNARYDNTTKEIVLTLQNGNTLRISVADLISGLVSETQLQTILANYYTKTEVNNLLNAKANQTSLDITNQNVTNLTGRVSKNEEDIADIKEEQTTQNEDIEELQSQVETLQEDLSTAEDEIEDLQQDAEDLRGACLSVEGTGTDITLNNTAKGRLLKNELSGRTEQEQLSGKNLFDKTDVIMGKTFRQTGEIIDLESSFITNSYIPVSSSTQYTISTTNNYISVIDYRLMICEYDENKEFIQRILEWQNTYKTITTTANTKYVRLCASTVTIDELQFEQGVKTSYEPYCGGIPSPNPDFPQPIQNVTGNANVKIQNKNLAWNGWAEDFVNRIDNSYQARIEQYDNRNCLRVNADAGYGDYDNKYIYKMDFKQNTQYTFVFDMLTTTTAITSFNIEIHYTDGTNPGVVKVPNNNWNKVIITSKVGKTIKYITPWYTNGARYIDLDTFMVLEGVYTSETIPDYVAHQEQNYPFTFAEGQRAMQGTTLQDDGIHNNRVHLVFDGAEEWEVQPNKEHTFRLILPRNRISTSGICSHYQNISSTQFDVYTGVYLDYSSFAIISDLRFSSVEDFKAWLVQQYNNGTPVEIEFVMRNNEEIIPYNETQQSQYNAIKQARSYDDITIISSKSDELGFNMDVESLANANKVINSLDTRLSALEGNTNQTRNLEVDTKNITKETAENTAENAENSVESEVK